MAIVLRRGVAGAEQDMTCSIIIHLWCLCQIITEKHMCATVLSTAPWDPRHILGEQTRRRGTVYRRHVYSIALLAHTDDLHFSFLYREMTKEADLFLNCNKWSCSKEMCIIALDKSHPYQLSLVRNQEGGRDMSSCRKKILGYSIFILFVGGKHK